MTTKKEPDKEPDEEWRSLCELVARETDPQRLSKLIDELIKKLDDRRKTLHKSEAKRKTPTDD